MFDGLDDDGIPVVVADTVLVRAADADAHLDGIRRIDVTTLSASDLARSGPARSPPVACSPARSPSTCVTPM